MKGEEFEKTRKWVSETISKQWLKQTCFCISLFCTDVHSCLLELVSLSYLT